MKKLFAMALAIIMCITLFCGCTSGQQVTNQSTNESEIISSIDEPEIIDLSVSNIEQYVAFNIDITDVEKTIAVSIQRCSAKLTIKTYSKQNVEFQNVTISFELLPESVTQGFGWDKVCVGGTNDEFVGELDIPYNGVLEKTFKIGTEASDSYITENPSLRIVVTEVTGQAVIK